MINGNVIRQVNDGANTWVDCSEEAFKRAKENGTPVREVHLNDESFRAAFDVWQDKTDWVQKDRRFDVLKPWGMHRGDVLKAYIEHLEARIASLEDSHKQIINARDHYKLMSEEGLKQLATENVALKQARGIKTEHDELLRECRLALDELISKKPALGGFLCGSTTLGNLRAGLHAFRSNVAETSLVAQEADK
ncbi:TPA: hypothetical protein ACKE3U_003828 [Klebsiella aerogenes]